MILIFILILTIATSSCKTDVSKRVDKLTVAVSITPEETFVRKVAGDKVDIVTMVPPGSSPENYQPTPRQMTNLSDAKLYFSMGLPADEISILPKMAEYNPKAKVVHLDKVVAVFYAERIIEENHEDEGANLDEDEHGHIGRDPHIWLSPKRVIVMIETIRDELTNLDPVNRELYIKNAQEFILELQELDQNIARKISESESKTILMYHPSYGYFADDYGLKMVAIEDGGKEATSQKIIEVINTAKNENIKIIFYQEEFDDGQAKTITQQINGTTIKVAPLGLDYIGNLNYISDMISGKEDI